MKPRYEVTLLHREFLNIQEFVRFQKKDELRHVLGFPNFLFALLLIVHNEAFPISTTHAEKNVYRVVLYPFSAAHSAHLI